jgi:hypothetical protein
MFKQLTELSLKRNWKQAIGFYIAWVLVIVVSLAVFGYLLGILTYSPGKTGAEGFASGAKAGGIASLFVTLAFSIIILRAKGILGSFKSILLVLGTAILALMGGGLLGMLIPAYLTTMSGPSSTALANPKVEREKREEHDGFQKYVSVKGVLLGSLINVIPSDIVGTLIIGVLAAHAHVVKPSPLDLQMLVSNFALEHPWWFQVTQIPGLIFSIVGGYVAARIAGRHELLNASLSAWWCVLSGIFGLFWLNSGFVWPLWANVLSIVLNVLVALLGGMVYLRMQRKPVRF